MIEQGHQFRDAAVTWLREWSVRMIGRRSGLASCGSTSARVRDVERAAAEAFDTPRPLLGK